MSYEELKKLSNDEITEYLKQADYQLMVEHNQNHYVNFPWAKDVEDQQTKTNLRNIDILILCSFGIFAYNKLSINPNETLKDKENRVRSIVDNLEMYFDHGHIPDHMQKYYVDVLNRGNVDYLNNYLLKNSNELEGGQERGRVLTKHTAAGRAFSDKENAFVSVLILPAMLALIYISVVVIYFVFFYGG